MLARRRLWTACCVAVLGLAAAAARADAEFELESRDLSSDTETAYRIATSESRVRMAVADGGDDMFDLVYRPDEDDILIIDRAGRKVQQLTKQMLRAMQTMDGGPGSRSVGASSQAQSQMSDALRGLPPEERVQLRKKLQSQGSGSVKEFAPAARQTGRTAEIAGISCEIVEMVRRGQKVSELCLADPETIPGGAEMMTAMQDMSAFYEDFSETLPPGTPAELSVRLAPWNGQFPLRIRRFQNGRAVSETVITGANDEAVAAAMFEAPEDYARGLVR